MPPVYKKKSGFDIEKAFVIGFIILIFIVSFGILFIPKDVLYKLSTLPLYVNFGF
jgi:cell division protein FtsL